MDSPTHAVLLLDQNKERRAIVESQHSNDGIFRNIPAQCQVTDISLEEALDALIRVLAFLEDEPWGLSCLSKEETNVLRRIEARMRKHMEILQTVPALMLPEPGGTD